MPKKTQPAGSPGLPCLRETNGRIEQLGDRQYRMFCIEATTSCNASYCRIRETLRKHGTTRMGIADASLEEAADALINTVIYTDGVNERRCNAAGRIYPSS